MTTETTNTNDGHVASTEPFLAFRPILPNGAPKELGNPRNIRLDHKHSQPDQGVSTAIPRARRVPSRATDALRTRRNSWRLMRNSASCSEVYKNAPSRHRCIRVLLI